MAARRSDARPGALNMRRVVGGLAVALALTGCIAPADEEGTNTTADVERSNRVEGDVEAAVGETIEVFGITATVSEVGRVASYSDLDSSGYIWAQVKIENTSNREVPFHRRHIRLEKPDGSLSNVANISTETQIEGGTARGDVLEPGEVREGQVIYTAGDLEGQFAIVYLPDSPSGDPLDRARGVWVFESGPDDAE